MFLRTICCLIGFLALAGCITAESVQVETSQTLCMWKLTSWSAAPGRQFIDQELQRRGQSCQAYVDAAEEKNRRDLMGIAWIGGLLGVAAATSATQAPSPPNPMFLHSEYVEGHNRICTYNDSRLSKVAITIPATSLCPPSR
jgi:hypothetical protein